MEKDQDAFLGAKKILHRCLGLRDSQDLVIFVDETTLEAGAILTEAAYDLGIQTTAVFVPVSLQRQIHKNSDLSLQTRQIAKDARAIISCINALPDSLRFRETILVSNWSARTRIGHMPGADLDVLRLGNVDFDKLINDCKRVEHAMARGKSLEFLSFACDGTTHRLEMDIGGWERLPVASNGIIQDGAWGNVPSGETFIAPIEGSGQGSVVINGSLPGMVIEPGAEITLFFDQGQLSRIEPAENVTGQWLQKSQIHRARLKGDTNWANLAEIGIGLNPGVENLTGNMLFDEKMAGTAHLALGANKFMGGEVGASIHCDMVARDPTILIDGKLVLESGKLAIIDSEWRENYAQVDLEASPLGELSEVTRSGTQAVQRHGRLLRVLLSDPGRHSTCPVGDDQTAVQANSLYKLLANGEWASIDALSGLAQLNPDDTRRILHVMWLYNLVNFR